MHIACPACASTNRGPEDRLDDAPVSDQAPDAGAPPRIRSIPTLLPFEGGQERARVSGAMPVGDLVSWIESHLPKGAA